MGLGFVKGCERGDWGKTGEVGHGKTKSSMQRAAQHTMAKHSTPWHSTAQHSTAQHAAAHLVLLQVPALDLLVQAAAEHVGVARAHRQACHLTRNTTTRVKSPDTRHNDTRHVT